MDNYTLIKKMLEYGGRVEVKYKYASNDSFYKFYIELAHGVLIEDEFGLRITKDFIDSRIIESIKFLPNPPKMYEVGMKVKVLKKDSEYLGKVLEIGYCNNYVYGFIISDTGNADRDFVEFSHFDLEPVFE